MRKSTILAGLAVAGCAAVPPSMSRPGDVPVHGEVPGYTCRDTGDWAVGRPATAELGAQLLARSGARTLRWVAHGMMVTMDYQPSRLTVYLDPQNQVERLSCG